MEACSLPWSWVTTIIISSVYLNCIRGSDIDFLNWTKNWHRTHTSRTKASSRDLEAFKMRVQEVPRSFISHCFSASLLCFPLPSLLRVVGLDLGRVGWQGWGLKCQMTSMLTNCGSGSKEWETNPMNGVAQDETHNGPTSSQTLFPMLFVPLLARGGTHADIEQGVVSVQMHKNCRHVCVSSFQGRPGSSYRTAEVG